MSANYTETTTAFKKKKKKKLSSIFCRTSGTSLTLPKTLMIPLKPVCVCATVLPRLDYCRAFLSGSPKQLLDRQHKVQNICCSPHLLVFKIRLCPSFKKNHCGLNDCGPEWLFQLYTPSRQLQFSSGTRLFLFNLSAWKPLDSGTKKKRKKKKKRKEKGDGKKDF